MPTKKTKMDNEILVHLSYIKEKLDRHDEKFQILFDKIDLIEEKNNTKLMEINKRMDTAEGGVKGVLIAASVGVITGIVSLIKIFGNK